jgi:hypothetical protein
MAITISAVAPRFVAEIGGMDLARPLAAEFDAIRQAFWDSMVLISSD